MLTENLNSECEGREPHISNAQVRAACCPHHPPVDFSCKLYGKRNYGASMAAKPRAKADIPKHILGATQRLWPDGIDPATSSLGSCILPLNYPRFLSGANHNINNRLRKS